MSEVYDVAVVGGGPAGLACALWLARYRLRTVLFDDNNPRNAQTWAVHGYLGLPDAPPIELRTRGQEQAAAAGAEIRRACVAGVDGEEDRFQVRLEDGSSVSARRVFFATGVRDIIPEIPGLMDLYGTSIWHCPDCDGPTTVGLPIGVIGWGRQIAAFCMEMLTWTDQITLLTHGNDPDLPEKSRAALERFGIPVITEPIERLEGEAGLVQRAVLTDGLALRFDAMFFHIAFGPSCPFPAELGCDASDGGILIVDENYRTSVPGVFAGGDLTPGSKLAIRAAADGTRAAIGIYRSLLPEERRV